MQCLLWKGISKGFQRALYFKYGPGELEFCSNKHGNLHLDSPIPVGVNFKMVKNRVVAGGSQRQEFPTRTPRPLIPSHLRLSQPRLHWLRPFFTQGTTGTRPQEEEGGVIHQIFKLHDDALLPKFQWVISRWWKTAGERLKNDGVRGTVKHIIAMGI